MYITVYGIYTVQKIRIYFILYCVYICTSTICMYIYVYIHIVYIVGPKIYKTIRYIRVGLYRTYIHIV